MTKDEIGSIIFSRENKLVIKFSLAIFCGLFLQAATIIWWASKLDYRVTAAEAELARNSQMIERVVRVEEKVSGIQVQTANISNQLQTLISSKSLRDRER